MPDEVRGDVCWAPVVGFPGYQVSNRGVVRGPRRLLVPLPDHGSYLRVSLYLGRRCFKRSIHQLVMAAFGPPQPSPNHEVAHGDGDRSHNWLDNLSWKTRTENEAEKREHGTYRCGEQMNSARLTEAQVREIRSVAHPKTADLAREYGVTYAAMAAVVKGQTWRHIALQKVQPNG